MKQLMIAIALFTTGSSICAQTYFYIDGINVLPTSPTSNDMITIDLSGGLSSTGAFISSASAEVIASTVLISIVAQDPGGATVIVPHTESLEIGVLPAGEYMIEINGANTSDNAPSGEHFFEVVAGDPCELLDIDYVRWSPFNDTALVVHVYEDGTETFGYPGFVLLAENGDTIASEQPDNFTIDGESYHTLGIHPDAVVPVGASSVTLHLWTWFYTDLLCSWDLVVDLCPPAPCETLAIGIQNFGGGITLGEFDWVLMDDEQQSIASGQLTMTGDLQYDQDTACVSPGVYSLGVTPLQPHTGGQPYIGVQPVEGFGGFGGPSMPLVGTPPVELQFDLYPACIDGTNNMIEPYREQGVVVRSQGDGFEIISLDGSAIGNVELFRTNGQLIKSISTHSNDLHMRLTRFPSGIYIVRIGKEVYRVNWTAH